MSRPAKSPAEAEALFWSRVDVRGPDDCWPWTMARFRFGYGRTTFFMDGRCQRISAHRLAHLFHYGETSTGEPGPKQVVRHSCDNPACCNPAHLSLGSHQDNVTDAISRGRQRGKHPSTLTEADLAAIRATPLVMGSGRALAKKYGVSEPCISQVRHGRRRAAPIQTEGLQ